MVDLDTADDLNPIAGRYTRKPDLRRLIRKTFEDHDGRPGKRGGSLPRKGEKFSGKKEGHFVIGKDNSLLCVRIGSANAIRQSGGGHAPVKRGFWVFPFGHEDAFFYGFRIKNEMPKKFRDESDLAIVTQRKLRGLKYKNGFPTLDNMEFPDNLSYDQKKKLVAEAQAKFEEESKQQWKKQFHRLRRQIWVKGGFYSHIPPPQVKEQKDWYYWESGREWAKAANKYISTYDPSTKRPTPFANDHFEIFVPELND